MENTKNPGVELLFIEPSYIKTYCSLPFIKTFRAILFHPKLSKQAKLLALVLVNSPFRLDQNFSIFARKMRISNQTMSKARRELQEAKVFISPAKVQENGP